MDDDPAAAYARSVEVVRAAVQAPGAMEATCHLSFGDFPGSEYARQLFLDTLVHGWDVAKATGQDTALDPRLVAAAYPIAENMAPAGRGAGVYGSEVNVPAEAPQQTRLLALLGRRA